MKRKYILHPGTVISKSDGDKHYITGEKLAELYGLPLSECQIVNQGFSRGTMFEDGVVHLYPDYTGEYKLPSKDSK